MALGPITSLFRIYALRSNVRRARVLLSYQNFHSLRQFNNWGLDTYQFSPSFDVSYRQFSTSLVDLIRSQLPSKNPQFSVFNPAYLRLFSSSVGDEDGEDSRKVELDENIGRNFVDNVGLVGGNGIGHGSAFVDESNSCDSMVVEEEERNPIDLYRKLRSAEKNDKLKRSDWETLQMIFSCFSNSGWAANQALAIYIGMSFFPTAAKRFRDFFFKKCPAELAMHLVTLGASEEAVRFLFPIFVEYCIEEFPDEIKRFRSMIESADLTKPHTWFPFARAMKRKIIYHCGPTNSGKTYNSLQRFMQAK